MDGKILILKTGELPFQVTDRHGPCERAFLSVLDGQGECVVVDARREELPEPKWDGIIITGSASSTYDGESWILRGEEFLKRAADQNIPLYGVCFGHQLLAQTFGGKVEKCARGWELGTVTVSVREEAEEDSLFAGLPREFHAQQSHGDVVGDLPPGAVCLAQNPHWPIQAFRLGDRIWGTQFHPEFTLPMMDGLVEALSQRLPREAFPHCPPDWPVREWILDGLKETHGSRTCLENFVKQARSLSSEVE